MAMIPKIPYYTKEDFITMNPIASGGGGFIFSGKLKDFGKIAVKEFFGSREQPLERYRKEIEILIQHKHPNIVQLYGILWDGSDKSILLGYVMEYVERGSLNKVIYDTTKSYDLLQIYLWIEQIARGIQFLHKYGIIHRDIKPANILVDGDKLKLADFGIAKNVDGITTAGAGTIHYMAPEALNPGKCSHASDVYSLAITIWEIFHRKVPYFELGKATLVTLSNEIIRGVRPSIEPNKMDKEVEALVQKCWEATPSDRLPVKDIIDIFEMQAEALSGQMGSNTATDINVSELQESMEAVTLTVNRNEVANVFNTLEEKVGSVSREKERKTILIAGGTKNGRTCATMAVLSADRSEWIELNLKLPYEAKGSGAVYLNGEIYLFGGSNNPKALYKLDKNMEWIRLTDMNEGRKHITNSCLEWNGYIWVFGGWNEKDKFLKSVERYDPKENKWTQMPDMETVRAWAATALWNDKMIISGGLDSETTGTDTMKYFDPEVGCWVEFNDMPTASGAHSLVTYKNKLILIGGAGSELFNSVWELDPQQPNSEWEPLPPMKYPSYNFAGIVLDNEIYAIGGEQGIDLPYLSRVEIFDGERWRDGPSLPYTWRCMSSVIIPQHFADRLCHFTKDNSNKCIVS